MRKIVMNKHLNHSVFYLKWSLHQLKKSIVFCCFLVLAACGSGGGGDPTVVDIPQPNGEIEGTGTNTQIMGIAAEGAAIANTEVVIKDLTGKTQRVTTNAQGNFTASGIEEDGPFLIRTTKSDGIFLYSIAHRNSDGEDEQILARNIHPFTDLVVRNWFAQENLDIDSELNSTLAITRLPSAEQVTAITKELQAIFSLALASYQVPDSFDLLSTSFEANSTGFDLFLDNTPIILFDNNITVSIQDLQTNIQSFSIDNISLDKDFVDDNDALPSTPENLRAIPASETEIIVVWETATDDKGIKGYNVYRNNTLITQTAYPVFIDQNLEAGIDYTYTVEAVDGRDQASPPTANPAMATITEPDTQAPPAATALELTEETSANHLRWTQTNIADVFRFEVLREVLTNNNTSNSIVIANITQSQFRDLAITANTDYCYRVVSIDAAENRSAPSEEACTSDRPTTPIEEPSPSVLNMELAAVSVAEDVGSVDVHVARTGNLSESISVDYAITGGTATVDADYENSQGTLTWAANDNTEKTITLMIAADTIAEPDETIVLTLSNPSEQATLGPNLDTTVTILDTGPVACIELTPTDITTSTTLDLSCYNVSDNITVTNAATLTIEPGVRLVFAAGKQLQIEKDGVLIARGTADQPITFTGSIAAAGYWDGLEITSIAESVLEHTIIEYGGGSSFNSSNLGISFGGKLALTDSIIRHSGSHGISINSDPDNQLTTFARNIITLNEKPPIRIFANLVSKLDSASQYSGNITISGGDNDFIEISNGEITTTQTWQKLDIDYHTPSSGIEVNNTLTLEPGVTLIFPANGRFNINKDGTLKAIGTASQPITFTGLSKTVGFWSGLQFTFNGNANEMDYTIVEYAGGETGNTNAAVGIFGVDGRLTLKNSTLRFSENYGFDFDERADITLENLTITDNKRPGILAANTIGLLDPSSDYSGNTDDRIRIRNDDIETAQTIEKMNVPYFFNSSTTYKVEASLAIASGVEIQFGNNSGFNINRVGSLNTKGTPEDPVRLTGAEKTKGYWNGLQFTFSESLNNILDNTIVEYAGSNRGNTFALVGLVGEDTNVTITNCILQHSASNGISLSNSSQGANNSGNTFNDIDGENIFIEP